MKDIKFEIIKILRNAMVTSITTPNVATLLKENDEIADEIVKLLATPAVVGQSEQLPCEHEERTMQGNGFTYVICSKCGEDL